MEQLVVYGIVLGSIIVLGAIGLTLTYGILNFPNFAHGDVMALGAYLAFLFYAGAGWPFGSPGWRRWPSRRASPWPSTAFFTGGCAVPGRSPS